MSQLPDPAATLSLPVSTGDSQSEILILDSRGRLVERGFGPHCTFDLEEGIYRVKVITGTEFQEKPVVLTQSMSKPLEFGPANFASPVPLTGTSTSHEYHMEAADRESRKIHVAEGTGSSLFFLVRDWTPSPSQRKQRLVGNAADGLSLYAVTATGEQRICDLAIAGTKNTWGDPWTACTIALAPGVYELRLALPTGDVLSQSVVASPGWQTQSFLFVRQYASESGPQWRADLSRTSVILTGVGGGFVPNEPMLRVAELARVRLAKRTLNEPGDNSQPLLPEEMRKLFREKFTNPMLGIYGAHLLLLEKSLDYALFRDVVGNLRGMVGPHPDVEALALRAELLPPPSPFDQPPMLSRSWYLITEATVDRPELVTDSLAHRSIGGVLTKGPWHVRSSTQPSTIEPQSNDLYLSDVEAALAEDLGVSKAIRRIQQLQSAVTGKTGVQQAAQPSQDINELMDSTRLRSMVTRFGIPAPQLRGLLNELEQKLNSNPRVPNLKITYK